MKVEDGSGDDCAEAGLSSPACGSLAAKIVCFDVRSILNFDHMLDGRSSDFVRRSLGVVGNEAGKW